MLTEEEQIRNSLAQTNRTLQVMQLLLFRTVGYKIRAAS